LNSGCRPTPQQCRYRKGVRLEGKIGTRRSRVFTGRVPPANASSIRIRSWTRRIQNVYVLAISEQAFDRISIFLLLSFYFCLSLSCFFSFLPRTVKISLPNDDIGELFRLNAFGFKASSPPSFNLSLSCACSCSFSSCRFFFRMNGGSEAGFLRLNAFGCIHGSLSH
jgi:hypothetical protein